MKNLILKTIFPLFFYTRFIIMSINLGFIEIIFLFGDLILKKKLCMSIEKRIIIYLFIIYCIILILFFMLN